MNNSENNNFLLPSQLNAITTERDLRDIHSRLLVMCKPKNKKQNTHLQSIDLNRVDVKNLINTVYRKIHGLKKGPFTRGDYILTHFDEDGDGKISSNEFASRMNVKRTAKTDSQRSSLDNTQIEATIAVKLARAKSLINTSRNALLDSMERPDGILWQEFNACLIHFTKVFEALGK